MVTTGTTVIQKVLKGFRQKDQPDVLVGAINASDTAISYQGLLNGWGVSTVAEIEDELLLVTAVNEVNNTATVIRGWLGTTAASHSINLPIYLNPKMMRSDILGLINEAIEDMMNNDLYKVNTLGLTYASGTIGMDLDQAVTKVLRVDAQRDATSKYWDPTSDWTFVDNADTTDFPSGKALMLRASLDLGAGVRVIYAEDLTPLSAESEDLEADGGLTSYMADIPFYFAMNRLMVDAERERSQIQGAVNHQRAQDVPAFLSLRTGEWYQARYREKVKMARDRLRREVKSNRGTGYGS